MKRIKKITKLGTRPVFNTNTDLGNYVSEGNIVNKNCVVDADYQGEVHISLTNTTKFPVEINAGDKIVQFLLVPVDHRAVEEVSSLDELYPVETERGSGGFGSTGTT
jgi:dUTPase